MAWKIKWMGIFRNILIIFSIFHSDFIHALTSTELERLAVDACLSSDGKTSFFDTKIIKARVNAVGMTGDRRVGMHSINWFFLPDGTRLKTFRFDSRAPYNALILELFDKPENGVPRTIPRMGLLLNGQCEIKDRRFVEFDKAGRPIQLLSKKSQSSNNAPEPVINPKLEDAQGRDGSVVAIIDSGINYLLPQVRQSLARDRFGKIIGYDFEDGDDRPFDEDYFLGSLWFPVRHGTSVASIVVSKAPEILLAPYRHPVANKENYIKLFDHMAANNIKVANISIGGPNIKEWFSFRDAAVKHPEILLIISAGNDGANLDKVMRYPASFGLKNSIVVAALDQEGEVLSNSNYGAETVDIGVAAQNISGFHFDGRSARLTGTSYAAPLVAAMAGRILSESPDISSAELKRRILAKAIQPSNKNRYSKFGQLPLN